MFLLYSSISILTLFIILTNNPTFKLIYNLLIDNYFNFISSLQSVFISN